MQHKHILLHLSLIDGVGSAAIATVLANQPNAIDLDDIYTMSELDLVATFGITPAVAQKIHVGLQDAALLAREIALLEKHAINWATSACPNYPQLLKDIPLLPPVLYYQGAELSTLENAISIVGSRKCDQYGNHVIKLLVPVLISHGWSIISGGALGIDSLAHDLTVQMGGRTVVVLGSGLLKPYPLENKKLFESVLASGGSIVSSFALNTTPYPGHFPARNRIIAGLSRGCVVVQAAQKSGALITARFALEQGKEVFAVPGSIDNPLSVGCNNLISQGAKLVSSAYDILQEYGYEFAKEPETLPAARAKVKQPAQAQPLKNRTRFKPAQTNTSADLSPKGIILANCQTPCSLDDLLEKTGLDQATLHSLLFDLQLDGLLVQNFMGMWQLAQI